MGNDQADSEVLELVDGQLRRASPSGEHTGTAKAAPPGVMTRVRPTASAPAATRAMSRWSESTETTITPGRTCSDPDDAIQGQGRASEAIGHRHAVFVTGVRRQDRQRQPGALQVGRQVSLEALGVGASGRGQAWVDQHNLSWGFEVDRGVRISRRPPVPEACGELGDPRPGGIAQPTASASPSGSGMRTSAGAP